MRLFSLELLSDLVQDFSLNEVVVGIHLQNFFANVDCFNQSLVFRVVERQSEANSGVSHPAHSPCLFVVSGSLLMFILFLLNDAHKLLSFDEGLVVVQTLREEALSFGVIVVGNVVVRQLEPGFLVAIAELRLVGLSINVFQVFHCITG